MESQWSRWSEPFSRAIGSDIMKWSADSQEAARVAVDDLREAGGDLRPLRVHDPRVRRASRGFGGAGLLDARLDAHPAVRGIEEREVGRLPGKAVLGQAGRRILGGRARQLDGFNGHPGDGVLAEVAGRGDCRARATGAPHQGANSERSLASLLHEVDLEAANARLDRVREQQHRVRSLGAGATGRRERLLDDAAGLARGGRAHPCVPPTVRPSIRSVGRPTPTGTLWPSFPQVPTP